MFVEDVLNDNRIRDGVEMTEDELAKAHEILQSQQEHPADPELISMRKESLAASTGFDSL